MSTSTRYTAPAQRTPTVDVLQEIVITRMAPDDGGTHGRSKVLATWAPSDPDVGEVGEMGLQRHAPLAEAHHLQADSGTPEGKAALQGAEFGAMVRFAALVLAEAGSTADPQTVCTAMAGRGETFDAAIEQENVAIRDGMLAWWDARWAEHRADPANVPEPTLQDLFAEFGWTPIGPHPFIEPPL